MAHGKINNLRSALLATALVLPAAAFAQNAGTTWSSADWDADQNQELSDTEFTSGFAETGTFNAWDQDRDAGVNEGEFATGMFSRWDTDNDLQISDDEYNTGAERWYGTDYSGSFTDYDSDQSGFVDRSEFGSNWDNQQYTAWDTDQNSALSEDEFNAGVYSSADRDQNRVISIEEEGWFEGWFDGDDIEAEIREVGELTQ